MATITHVYKDSGLLEAFDDATDTLDAFALNGADGDGVFYVGEATASKVIEAESDPGIDPIVVSIIDAASGSGVEDTDIKLALTSGDLDLATAGASLSLGAAIASGSGNAVPVHYRWANSVGAGPYTEISLSIVSRITRDA